MSSTFFLKVLESSIYILSNNQNLIIKFTLIGLGWVDWVIIFRLIFAVMDTNITHYK